MHDAAVVSPDLSTAAHLQTDWLVIGSGFGGSVAALRLAEKGYDVTVLEQGERFADADFANSAWQLGRVLWSPRWGLRGIMRQTPFRHVTVLSGVGVGGGSLVYGNTLYVPSSDAFYRHPQWGELADWRAVLAPHYATAKRMLGVVPFQGGGRSDQLMADLAGDLGVASSLHPTDVGVWFGEPGQTVPDPYFGGDGPDRTGCVRCGQCMLGCRYGAKNTLVKNYLALAERLGVRVAPRREVTDIRPLGAADGSDGYAVTSQRSGAWVRRDRHVHTARGVVVAGGALGTAALLRRCRDGGSLPALSDQLGNLVRTNSEAITAVTAPTGHPDLTADLAITASLHPDADTHVTNNSYGAAGDALGLTYGPLTSGSRRWRRVWQFAHAHVRHPARWLSPARVRGWSSRTVIFTVMQSSESSLRLRPTGRRGRLQTELAAGPPPASHLPIANRVAELAASRLGGVPQTSVLESLRGAPTTAHLLGGAVIGADAASGVVDRQHRAYGYRNLLITDGSTVPANVGVNPSLTITALAEEAMTHVPDRPSDQPPVAAPAPAASSSLRVLRRAFQDARTPALDDLVGFRKAQFAGPAWLRALGPITMATTGMPGWQGKRFRHSGDARLAGENLVRRGNALEPSIPMHASLEAATADGRPALVVRYPADARWPWRRVRDELRPLADGRLLGMTYGLPGTSPKGVPFILHPPEAHDA
ncbi:MAG: GMC family oxidoreductase [Solirubrobacteraceae bacterium]|nr:GMC family oxidoreductase [Solirubrobacteraceae bacterium]